MNRDFGELSELVKVVGMLMSAAFAITLAWRGRTRWEPSEQDLPEAPKRVAGLLTAIVLPVLWVVLASPSHAGLLASLAFALVLASILFLIFYSLHVGVLTYELPRDEGQPSPKRVVGGYWLTTEARRKTLLKTSPLSPAEYLTMVGEPDKVWPRLSRALARVSFLLGYVGFVVCGSAGLTCAAILFIVGTSAEGEGDPGNQPTAEVRIREVVGVVGTSEEGEGESGNQTAAEEPIRERDRVVGTSEEGEGESGSQTAAEEPIRERDQEVEGDPDNQRKMEELFRELDRVEGELRNATSRADVIRVLSRGLNQVEEAATSISDPGANYRVAWLCYLLQDAYVSGSLFEKACEWNERSFGHLKRTYDRDPSWSYAHPPGALPVRPMPNVPVAYAVAGNRMEWAVHTHARLNGRLDENTRRQVITEIEIGIEALEKAKVTEILKGTVWVMSCLAYWANGNIDRAETSLDKAFLSIGTAGPAGTESEERRSFFGNLYLLRAALQAERRKCEEARVSIVSAKDYLRNEADPSGIFGHMYLLVARASTSPPETKELLDIAHDYLSRGDMCAFCRYNLACTLAKKSEFADGAARDELLRVATDHLMYLLNRLKIAPFEPEVGAIRTDPFLKDVVSQELVEMAIESFRWDPKEGSVAPPLSAIWYSAIPLKGIRFTRLNGDDRGF